MKYILFVLLTIILYNNSVAQTLSTALKDLESGRYTKAEELFKQLLEKEKNAKYAYYLGYFYLRSAQFAKAENAFLKAYSYNSNFRLADYGYAAVHLAYNQPKIADSLFAELIRKTKGNDYEVMIRIAEAYTLFSTSDGHKSLKILEMIAQNSKISSNTKGLYYLIKGDAHAINRETQSAIAAYKKALTYGSYNFVTHTHLGLLYRNLDQPRLAREQFLKALIIDSTYAPAHFALAKLYMADKKEHIVAYHYHNYLRYADTSLSDSVECFKHYFLANDFKKTIELYQSFKDKPSLINDPDVERIMALTYGNKAINQPTKAYSFWKSYLTKIDKSFAQNEDLERMYQVFSKINTSQSKTEVIQILEALCYKDSTKNYFYETGRAYFNWEKNYKTAAKFFELSQNYELKKYHKINYANYFSTGRSYYFAYQNNKNNRGFLKASYQNFEKLTKQYPNYSKGFLWLARVQRLYLPETERKTVQQNYQQYLQHVDKSNASPEDILEAENYSKLVD
ncbi:tetratricopeptide repeat protein [Emticicia sp. SJ17W-69]|uniref:tetratricopeptide repeat protein n=1 Tax=Emticicia sp. SJ17W-69 TaxID=3421657 RepID=UPI003EBBF5EB